MGTSPLILSVPFAFGAVAWPGEIDLAPDAMYAEVVGREAAP